MTRKSKLEMYKLFRPLLFKLDPETAHHLPLQLLRMFGDSHSISRILHRMYSASNKPVEVFGMQFRNPIGLAAGYDKDGIVLNRG